MDHILLNADDPATNAEEVPRASGAPDTAASSCCVTEEATGAGEAAEAGGLDVFGASSSTT